MHENIQVQCSGAFYTSLHCEIIHNAGIQEGFFKGEIEKHTSFDINDSDLNSENAIIKINISGYIPCASVGSFYNGCGKVSASYIENLTDNVEEIVGWYRCRRSTNGSFLKEVKVHEQLREMFSSKGKYFLFALFTRNDETPSSTMDTSYKFQVMLNSCEFSSIPLNIINLNNTSASGYIKAASSKLYNSEALEKILLKIQNLEPGVKEVESIHMGLICQVQSLLPKFASVQEKYHQALQRLNKLKEHCHNYELKLGEECDTQSIVNEKDADDGNDSCVRSEVEKRQKKEKISEDKMLLQTKEAEDAASIQESQGLNNDEKNLTKISKLNDDQNVKKNSKSHSSHKGNSESHSDNNNKTGIESFTTSHSPSNETLKDSSLKKMSSSSGENTSKENKNEINVNVAKETTVSSSLTEEICQTDENKMCSDSPEF